MDSSAPSSKSLGPFTWKGRVYGVPASNTAIVSAATSVSSPSVTTASPSAATAGMTRLVSAATSHSAVTGADTNHSISSESEQPFKVSPRPQQPLLAASDTSPSPSTTPSPSTSTTNSLTVAISSSSPSSSSQAAVLHPLAVAAVPSASASFKLMGSPPTPTATVTASGTPSNATSSQPQLQVPTSATAATVSSTLPSVSSAVSSSSLCSVATSTAASSVPPPAERKRKLDQWNAFSEAHQKKRIVQALQHDVRVALQPSYRQPLHSFDDVWRALLPFHVFQSEEDLKEFAADSLQSSILRKRRRHIRRSVSRDTERRARELLTRAERLLRRFRGEAAAERREPWQEEYLLMQRLLYAEERQEFEQLKGAELHKKQQLLQHLQLQRQQQQQHATAAFAAASKGLLAAANHLTSSSSVPSTTVSSSLATVTPPNSTKSFSNSAFSGSATGATAATGSQVSSALSTAATTLSSSLFVGPSTASLVAPLRVNNVPHTATVQLPSRVPVQSSSLSSGTTILAGVHSQEPAVAASVSINYKRQPAE
jgi:hypothetical protein